MPLVNAEGSELRAGKRPFTAFGFNYGGRSRPKGPYSFDDASKQALRGYVAGMREARGLGANALRIYLQLFDFVHRVRGQIKIRHLAQAHLRYVLAAAERLHLYLDLTGNLVWLPSSSPGWYDRMPARQRWRVQSLFWRAVAGAAAPSPAVLCYELTSEPAIGTSSPSWYAGGFGGLKFVQFVVKDAGHRDRAALARQWIRTLRAAIRSRDRRHLIGLGLLGSTRGPFGPRNVAGLLDVLLVHIYPTTGRVDSAVGIARAFAAPKKPVILGETAMLFDNRATQKSFLLRSRRYLDGYLSFFSGEERNRPPNSPADALRRKTLVDFLSLRSELLTR
jgi:hypothetical protein